MAMYCQPSNPKRAFVDEAGVDLMVTQGPPLWDNSVWGNVWLYYWAMQINFVNDVGAGVGGGHCGIQAYDNPLLTKKAIVNWGVYDDTIGNYATFRQSEVLTADAFIDINNNVSMGVVPYGPADWDYGDWLRFRVFRSPKQDWLASQIKPGDQQVPPYVDTDQQPDEVAFRCSIENLTKGRPPVPFHDVLIKSPAASRPMTDGEFWTEPIGYEAGLDSTWLFSPEARWRHHVWDGPTVITNWQAHYAASAANCDIVAVAAAGGQPGYLSQRGGTTRTTVDGTILTAPAGFWNDPQPNVASNIHDNAPRVATRRPWF
jgi:hypothetical protein